MTDWDEPKNLLRRYLQGGRDAMMAKLDGLSEYDARRPLTPSGTNVLGLIKHLASCELGYFGDVFGRPSGIPLPWWEDDAEPDADMWATPQESREEIVALYRKAWEVADGTFDALSLEETGKVPWWTAPADEPTLLRVMVHMIAETSRHAGHADILRETIDGATGMRGPGDNMSDRTAEDRLAHHARLEAAAKKSAEA